MPDRSEFDLRSRPELTLPDTAGATLGEDDIGDLFPVSPRVPGSELYRDESGAAQWIQYPGEEALLTVHMDTAITDWSELRIRREGSSYRLRYVDEYPEHWVNGPVLVIPAITFLAIPTFGEILAVLDATRATGDTGQVVTDLGLIQHLGTMQGDPETPDGRTAGMAFIRLESEPYPQLPGWYLAVAREYVETGSLTYVEDAPDDEPLGLNL